MMNIVVQDSNSRMSTEQDGDQFKPVSENELPSIEIENLKAKDVLRVS